MDALAFFLTQHARLHFADVGEERPLADRIFGGLTDEQLRLRPGRGFNSLAWLLWHMARTEDVAVNVVVANRRQVFDDGWEERLKVRRRDIGTGMTDEEVAQLSAGVDIAAVKAYRSAVGRRTREAAAALPAAAWQEIVGPADIERAGAQGAFGSAAGWVAEAWQGQSRATRLGATAIAHNAMHLGEAGTIRGQASLPVGL
jgi:hypothetical protein